MFLRSSDFLRTMRQKQREAQIEPLELILWNATRWLGVYQALERFLKLEDHLRAAYIDQFTGVEGIPAFPTPDQANLLRKYLEIVKSAYNRTLLLQAKSTPLLSAVPMIITGLFDEWAPTAIDPQSAAQLRAALLAAAHKRFDFLFQSVNLALLAAAVDPRYGNLPWISSNLQDEVWKVLAEEHVPVSTTPGDDSGFEIDIRAAGAIALTSLRKHLQQKASSYAADKVNPLDWWQKMQTTANGILVPLGPLVRMLLAIPATTASAERVFAAYTILREGRERLGPDQCDRMLQIQHHIRQPGYSYEHFSSVLLPVPVNK